MSEITEKLQSKLSRVQTGELVMNIILGVWAIVTAICFIADVTKIHAVMIVFGISAFLIAVVDGYFIFAIFYFKRKINKQQLKEGIIVR